MAAEIRSGRATPFQAIYSWLLARVGQNLDVLPGEEFRVALREAQALNAQVVLGDRPLTVTLARVWAALSLWEKFKLSGQLLWTGLSLLDREDMKAEIERMKVGWLGWEGWEGRLVEAVWLGPIDRHGRGLPRLESRWRLRAGRPRAALGCAAAEQILVLPPLPRPAQESDALTEAIKELGKDFPSLIRPLLTERDECVGGRLGCWPPLGRRQECAQGLRAPQLS